MKNAPFIFEKFEFQKKTGTLHMHYRYEDGPALEETITFPLSERRLSQADDIALNAAFRLIFLLSGVSYYKAYVPTELKCPAFPLNPETADFVAKVYLKGLAEFAVVNKLDLADRINFETKAAPLRTASPLGLPRRSLVPVGGGKDSIVTLETLKEGKEPFSLFALGSSIKMAAPIEATIETSGAKAVRVVRTLSPMINELNKAGAYNGHVPITAILSAIAVATAIIEGFDTVILSNEHSASEPNLWMDENEVNHQYSKSFEFESDLANYVTEHIAPDLNYFSILRPLSETEIARRFARFTSYHQVFLSCNKAFKQDAAARGKSWCCNCPKCRFVFLALAPVLEKDHLVGIFGKDMLDDVSQTEGFSELCGLTAHKPFECVGETGESALLMQKLYRSDVWKNDAVVKALGPKLQHTDADFEQEYRTLFALRADHAVPDKYLGMLDASH
jgi:hypothetical protein